MLPSLKPQVLDLLSRVPFWTERPLYVKLYREVLGTSWDGDMLSLILAARKTFAWGEGAKILDEAIEILAEY